MTIDLGDLIVQSFFAGLASAVKLYWQMALDHPWIFVAVGALVLLSLLSRRVRRHRRS